MDSAIVLALVSAALSGGLFGGIAGALVDHYLNLRRTREMEILARRRSAYEQFAHSLRVFVGSGPKSADEQRNFLRAYDSLWLWADDDLLTIANNFVSLNEQRSAGRNITQDDLKGAYAKCIESMRRSLGFAESIHGASSYRFVDF